MPEPLVLFCSIVFGILGLVYCKYGRKENFYFVLAGICLMGYTFLVDGGMAVLLTGLALAAAPFIMTKFM